MEIIPFESHYAQDFKRLNEAWLEHYFVVEPYDSELLGRCEESIIKPGGFIFFVRIDEQIVGTRSHRDTRHAFYSTMNLRESCFELLATLGAYMKYPKASLPHKPTQHVADKKFGFYQAQATDFSTLAQDLGLASTKGTYFRHPLAYLVEAADDICYTIIDFEDGINLGWISESYALEYLINLVKDSIDKKTYASLKHTPQRMSYLRALAINSLIKDAVAIFLKNEEAILSGSFPHALLDKSKYAAQIDDIISLSVEKVYHSPEVLQKEIVGYKVITTLLDAFTTAAVHEFKGEADAYDQLILRLVPKGTPFLSDSLYDTLLNATCYVASLSDGKAMELSKKMK